jgi:hypothetical protein
MNLPLIITRIMEFAQRVHTAGSRSIRSGADERVTGRLLPSGGVVWQLIGLFKL